MFLHTDFKKMQVEVNPRNRRNSSKITNNDIDCRVVSLSSISKRIKCKLRLRKKTKPLKSHSIERSTLYNRGYYTLNENDPECFYRAIGPILRLTQFFGVLPISNLHADNLQKLSVRKLGPRAIYSYIVLLGTFFMASVSFIHLFLTLGANSLITKRGFADATAGVVFYGVCFIGNYLFLQLCPGWISLQHDWRAMERMLDSDSKRNRPRLRWKFAIIAGTMLSIALIEHILCVVNYTPYHFFNGNCTLEQFLKFHIEKSHGFIIKHVEYNVALGIFIFLISKISTFTWSFIDVFIILVSTGIAERYKRLNARVIETPSGQMTVLDWHKLRKCYAILSALVKQIDNRISSIILLSSINNIYFICLHCLNGLTPRSEDKPIISSIYFFGSFIALIARATSVILFASRINDQCKSILPVLYNCPSVSYCIETQRLQHQITSDVIALTGLNFFSITRQFLLTVAGAIVTYEVILLQFNMAIPNN